MGVGCKLVQFVVFCVLFVMMLTNIEKNLAVSDLEEGHVLTTYGFFLVVSLASMQIKSGLLKSLFQNKTPDLRLKYNPSA